MDNLQAGKEHVFRQGYDYMKNSRFSYREAIYFLAIVLVVIGASVLNLSSVFRTLPSLLLARFDGLFFSRLYTPALYLSYPLYILAIIVVVIKSRKFFIYKLLLWIILFFVASILIGSIYLSLLEAKNYSNFVFSNYHIFLPSLKTYAEFHTVLVIMGLLFFIQKEIKLLKNIVSANNFIVLFLAVFLYSIVFDYPQLLSQELLYWRNYILVPVNQRPQALDLRDFSGQMLFLKRNTPDNAVIVHPTQSSEFPFVGNQPLVTYFLYPRLMVSPDAEESYYASPEGKDAKEIFYILAKDSENKIFFPAGEMITEEIRVLLTDDKVNIYKGVSYNAAFIDSLPDFKVGIIKRLR
jgi:hypothetical protein